MSSRHADRLHHYGRIGSICLLLLISSGAASAQTVAAPASCSAVGGECLCDNSYQDCRTPLIDLIRRETAAIDVSFWFMTDWRYSSAIIARWRAGVPVRIILDTQADTNYPANLTRRTELANAGIPIRDCISPLGINHWKTMIFAGQEKLMFSAANFSDGSFSPSPLTSPYTNYVDEAIYFTADPAIVHSFMNKFDDHWTDTVAFANLANISAPLSRNYPAYAIDPALNFVPGQNFEDRLRAQIALENDGVDAVIFRITSAKIPDALIARKKAGVDVRLITDVTQYRTPTYFWDSYNVDRMYAAGIPIKVKDNFSDQDMHQKSIVLHSRGLSGSDGGPMTVFGSSNWTSSSASGQREHNYFTRKPWMVDWFIDQFERKWNNTREDGTPIGRTMYLPFRPLAPDVPVYAAPLNDAAGQGTTVTLRWEGGWWAHRYDIYLSTTSTFGPPVVVDYAPGSATAGVQSAKESYALTGLQTGTTYYWRVVSKTMANVTKTGPAWRFTTGGVAPPPSSLTPFDVVLHAARAAIHGTSWSVVPDAAAAGGKRISNPNAGAATVTTPLASPASYFEMQFHAEANRPYRLWLRGKAAANNGYNDSVWVQFTNTVRSPGGAPVSRIGTTSAEWVNLQDGPGLTLNGWAWQDNAYGGLGPVLYFTTSGTQTVRVQVREDGISLDQIVLSPDTYLQRSPGLTKLDTVILPEQDGLE